MSGLPLVKGTLDVSRAEGAELVGNAWLRDHALAGDAVGRPARRGGLGAVPGAVLFQTRTSDPVTFAAVAAMLVVIGTVATLVPALRAGRTDPLQALRGD
jgi:hypothetical protein